MTGIGACIIVWAIILYTIARLAGDMWIKRMETRRRERHADTAARRPHHLVRLTNP